MRFAKIVATALCLSLTTPALADPKTPRVESSELHGDFYFYTFAKKDGQPVCSERWRFGDDGVLTVYSGQEVATEHFQMQSEANVSQLAREPVATNGLPDCVGHIDSGAARGKNVIYIWRAMDKGIAICALPANSNVMNCYGHLYRAADVDAAEQKAAPVK